MWKKVSQVQLALYLNTCIQYGHVYVQFCDKWQTLVWQNIINEEKDQPSPIGHTYEHRHIIWSCLCTILQQMADYSAKNVK